MEAGRYIDGELLSYADAALAALDAGCDLAMLCNQSIGEGRPLDELLDGFAAAAKAGRWRADPRSEVRRRALVPETLSAGWEALVESAEYKSARQVLAKARLAPPAGA